MLVVMENPKTTQQKTVKIGWSWTCFFFSSFFGIPLFLRGLYVWGGLMCGLYVLQFISGAIFKDPVELAAASITLFVAFMGFAIWFGISANKMYGLDLLSRGWQFKDPDSEAAKQAKLKWGLAV